MGIVRDVTIRQSGLFTVRNAHRVTTLNPALTQPDLGATVASTVSDTAHERFGIRSVTSALNASGARTYTVNGRPLLIRGGGWAPDLLLRWDQGYVRDRLGYALDLGLNTIRLEGHI